MNKNQQDYFMARALTLSKQALPACLPNPPVGCVLVKDGKAIASGYTQAPGHPHAEAAALASYAAKNESMDGVTAFVTLEPCSFHGRTPSCAKALIERGIKTVYVAMRDPDPRNNGKRLSLLTQSGITVHENILADTVAEFLMPYLNNDNNRQ